MSYKQQKVLFLARVVLGWLIFYAGITKVLNPEWSAKGYLLSAKTFSSFYAWLASDSILPIVNFLNEWGLTLIGLSLIIGALVRLSSLFGVLIMILYYFPVLTFPKVGDHSYLVDDHIVYAVILILFVAFHAGLYYGLDKKLREIAKLRPLVDLTKDSQQNL